MTFNLFKISICYLPLILFFTGCSSNEYFSVDPSRQTIRPRPRLNVYVMPKAPVDLAKKKVLMIPAFMAGNQEEIWGNSVTSLVRSILLQENVFGTLALNPNNHQDRHDMLRIAREKGFDYLLEITLPGIIEPAGDSPGWVGLNLHIISTKKGYSIWQIYGESQLLPQPTFHGFFKKKEYVPAPTVGQGIEAITRTAANIIKAHPAQIVNRAM